MPISQEMKDLARDHPLGFVATVNGDGTPNLSPKGTMLVISGDCILFGEIRSPVTLRNIRARPAMEINFADTLARRCFRARGQAEVIARGDTAFDDLHPLFGQWGELAARIRHIIRLRVTQASIVTSPAYDLGQTEAELKAHWKAHYASL